MKIKKTIIIIIDNLIRGGAETLLHGILPDIAQQYNVVLVTLTDQCDFDPEEIACNKLYSLGFSYKIHFIRSFLKLSEIIRQVKPDLIHTHLVYSSLFAKLAAPDNIPLVYTLHSIMSKCAFDNSKVLTWLEKKSLKKNHSVIAVSHEVLQDYTRVIQKPEQTYVLKNYVNDIFFEHSNNRKEVNKIDSLKMVCVGNIKYVKNYIYLIEAFKLLKGMNVSLDIYGDDQSHMQEHLQHKIDEYQVPVYFKGKINHVETILPNYDLYVMPSHYEGFGIAAVEAMAMGLPLLLSDLQVLREVTNNHALFFDTNDVRNFVDRVNDIFGQHYNLNELSERGVKWAATHFKKEHYLKQLFGIYDSMLEHTVQI